MKLSTRTFALRHKLIYQRLFDDVHPVALLDQYQAGVVAAPHISTKVVENHGANVSCGKMILARVGYLWRRHTMAAFTSAKS
jgi:hypothetical protein